MAYRTRGQLEQVGIAEESVVAMCFASRRESTASSAVRAPSYACSCWLDSSMARCEQHACLPKVSILPPLASRSGYTDFVGPGDVDGFCRFFFLRDSPLVSGVECGVV